MTPCAWALLLLAAALLVAAGPVTRAAYRAEAAEMTINDTRGTR